MALRFEYSAGDSLYVLLTGLILTIPPFSYLVLSGKLARIIDAVLTYHPFTDARGPIPLCPGSACVSVRRCIKSPGPDDLDSKSCDFGAVRRAKGFKFTKIARYAMYASWALLGLCILGIMLTPTTVVLWDPYSTLGITPSASKIQIKKAYRKLSLTKHPDKVPLYQREEATKEFAEIIKAYKVLTERNARENWEKYGNPDGPGRMTFGIALPPWVRDLRFVFFGYIGLLLGIGFIVRRVWTRFSQASGESEESSNFVYQSVGSGFSRVCVKVIEKIAQVPENKLTFESLVAAMASDPSPLQKCCVDVDDCFFTSPESDCKKKDCSSNSNSSPNKKSNQSKKKNSKSNENENERSVIQLKKKNASEADSFKMLYASIKEHLPTKFDHSPRFVYLYAHFLRKLNRPYKQVICPALAACVSALDIACRRNAQKDIMIIISVMRSLVIGRLPDMPVALQLPFIEPKHIETIALDTGNNKSNIQTILDTAFDSNSTFRSQFSEAEIAEMRSSAFCVPDLQITGASCVDPRDYGELDSTSTKAVLTVSFKTTRSDGTSVPGHVCAPHYPGALRNGVWVFLFSPHAVLAAKFIPFTEDVSEINTEVDFLLPERISSSIPATAHIISPYYNSSDEIRLNIKVNKGRIDRNAAVPDGIRFRGKNPRRTIAEDNNDDLIASFG